MRKTLWAGSLAAALAIAAWGCGGGASKERAASEDSTPAVDQAAADAGEVEATPARIPVPEESEAARVSLSGKLGCGHCTYHVKDSCTLAMKTDGGEVYLVQAGTRQEELMGKRYDDLSVLVTGRIGEEDGFKVVYADSVEVR
jgi:hypothetical protein